VQLPARLRTISCTTFRGCPRLQMIFSLLIRSRRNSTGSWTAATST
jgi:hypothetical protein